MHESTTPPRQVGFRQALAFWFKLGWISFGGPAGQIAIMHSELVERRRWISPRRFLHALNYCMFLPGPEAQQTATYIGWLLHGTWGGLAAGGLFVLPSLAILMVLSWIYVAWGTVPAIAAVFAGLKPAMVAVVAAAVVRLASRAIPNGACALVALTALAAMMFKIPFPAIIVGAGALGFVVGQWWPEVFRAAGDGPDNSTDRSAGAVLDDHHDSPPHTRPSRARQAAHLAVGLALWAGPLAALTAWQGSGATLPRMGRFFTQAALVTFGGAYAVLPYVRDYSIDAGWLEPGQMLDGLALGETTPGPLIMIVAFVGFVGGAQATSLGMAGGALGCLVATYYTFLPSFLFILLGAPLVERTRGMTRLTAALSGITAAVVGVMLHLAITLALQVLLLPHARDWLADAVDAAAGRAAWQGPAGVDAWAVAVAAAAFVALWRFKAGIVQVVLVCGLLGLARMLSTGSY